MKQKILCVDDEVNVLKVLERLPSQEGYDVQTANSADEFGKVVFDFEPHLMILDIMLGDKNGVQVYDHLIQKGLNPKIPVIFLSGLVQENQASLASPSTPGRTYVLMSKPFKTDELINQIKTLLTNKP